VVVASGEPGIPVTCRASTVGTPKGNARQASTTLRNLASRRNPQRRILGLVDVHDAVGMQLSPNLPQ
jgi:hypothetical protein